MYEQRDLEALGQHYMNHVVAMTAEELHSKADIAAELAWRDQEIERLRGEVERLRLELQSGENMNGILLKRDEGQKKQIESLTKERDELKLFHSQSIKNWQANNEKLEAEVAGLSGANKSLLMDCGRLEGENIGLKKEKL